MFHLHPPTLSTKVMRKLGEQFCSLKPEELTEENLRKKGQKDPVGSKKTRSKKTNHALDGGAVETEEEAKEP